MKHTLYTVTSMSDIMEYPVTQITTNKADMINLLKDIWDMYLEENEMKSKPLPKPSDVTDVSEYFLFDMGNFEEWVLIEEHEVEFDQ